MRLDVALRVYEHARTLPVNYNGAGNVNISLTAGLYMTAAALAAELQTQLQTVDASLTCSEVDGVYTLAGNDPFIVTWQNRTLRDWLGFTGTATSNADTHAGATSPGVWVAALPWTDRTPLGWSWAIKGFSGPRAQGRSRQIGKITHWAVMAHVDYSELAQARSVLELMDRGMPATWWRDETNGSAWSNTNWYGTVEVAFGPDMRGYADGWRSMTPLRVMDVPLKFVEWTG